MVRIQVFMLSNDFDVIWTKVFSNVDILKIPENYTLDGMLQSEVFDKYYHSVLRIILQDSCLADYLNINMPDIMAITVNDKFLTPDAFNNLCDFKDTPNDHIVYQKQIQEALEKYSGIRFIIPTLANDWKEKQNKTVEESYKLEKILKEYIS